jgi:hypothetical protein
MLKKVKDHKDLPHFLFSILSTSGTLAGLSLALVGIVNLKVANTKIETIADDMFLFSSVGFFAVCYIIFFTLRQHQAEKVLYWTKLIDVVFLSSITLLVVAGFVVVYTFL